MKKFVIKKWGMGLKWLGTTGLESPSITLRWRGTALFTSATLSHIQWCPGWLSSASPAWIVEQANDWRVRKMRAGRWVPWIALRNSWKSFLFLWNELLPLPRRSDSKTKHRKTFIKVRIRGIFCTSIFYIYYFFTAFSSAELLRFIISCFMEFRWGRWEVGWAGRPCV